ncbi:MAG: four-helix bundle copper-binding protein, partial [Burkholderiales bacterium]|nr:four-helix bundle copper-binding protein [Burkholderiales bacterium]
MVPTDLITPGMERCAAACIDCHRQCLRAAMREGLVPGGAPLSPEHVRLLLDCAALTMTTADFMLRGSAFHERVSEACAEVCDATAQSC